MGVSTKSKAKAKSKSKSKSKSKAKKSKEPASKKAKIEEEVESEESAAEEDEQVELKRKEPQSSSSSTNKAPVKRRVDRIAGSGEVVEDYDCVLNQTNIKNNNNKFYIIQVLKEGSQFFCFTRWGRVGEDGQSNKKPFGNVEAAKKEFEKKFKEKTKNNWADRDNFKAVAGQYTMITIHHGEDDEEEEKEDDEYANTDWENLQLTTKKLSQPVAQLVYYIYGEATQSMINSIDCSISKNGIETPLGVLSMEQIEKGDAILDKILKQLEAGKKNTEQLSSEYYSNIPHRASRNRAELAAMTINTKEKWKEKTELSQLMKDMLDVSKKGKKGANPLSNAVSLDEKYDALGINIEVVDKDSDEFNNIVKHIADHLEMEDHANFDEKNGDGFNPKAPFEGDKIECEDKLGFEVVNIYRVERPDEIKKYNPNKLHNEHILFHASRMKNFVGILSRGLLLPAAVTALGVQRTDFGWLGAGIYFGAEWQTSAGYSESGEKGTSLMILTQVALGNVQEQLRQDGSITKPKPGFHSLHGNPEPADDAESEFDDHEYCVYTQHQHKIRYLVEFSE